MGLVFSQEFASRLFLGISEINPSGIFVSAFAKLHAVVGTSRQLHGVTKAA